MPHPRFLLEGGLGAPGLYRLGALESHHAANVLRLRPGDAVIVFDGCGRRGGAVVVDAAKAGVTVRVDDVFEEPRLSPAVAVATAIPKGKRWQALVEKCTELGVDSIVPVLTERSVAKGEGGAAKWRRWAVEAAKQSRRAWVPEIGEPAALADVFGRAAERGALLLVADGGGLPPSSYREELRGAAEVFAVVGPEGGLTAGELEDCARRGGKTIRLSPFVLRVETAAATVCAIVREAVL